MATEGISKTCFLVIIPEAIAGIFSSLLIMLVVFKHISINVNMSTKDKILLPMSISHLGFTILMFINVCHNFFQLGLTIYTSSFISALILYCVWSGTSLSLCMCFLHFFEIIQFRSRLLSLVNMKIEVLIPWMVVLIEGASLCGCVLNIMLHIDIPEGPSTNISISHPYNATGETFTLTTFIQMFLDHFAWLLLVIFCTAFTMASIARHACRMGTSISCVHSKVEAQKVVRSELSFLIFYVLFLVVMIVVFAEHIHRQPLGECLYNVFVFTFPTLHCVLIIGSNTKYKDYYRSACTGRGGGASKT